MAQAKAGGKSDMNGWTDGVAYTDLTVVNNSYCTQNGQFISYNGWKRTEYVPCDGASSISFPKVGGAATNVVYNSFFSANHAPLENFRLSTTAPVEIPVPSNAAYFAVSNANTVFDKLLQDGIIPHK